uniref:Uncharacterized protein n=1 Tax=Quercus lobata TaxID=97700 RepID=A0A7N2MMP0_QUELO
MLQELKLRASGNLDDPFSNPGIFEKQLLHVVMVEPKVSNKSRFTQELISTILFTIALGLVWMFMPMSSSSNGTSSCKSIVDGGVKGSGPTRCHLCCPWVDMHLLNWMYVLYE